ncbi:MAG: hypothetical protein PSV18_14700 [Methylobacter sp.]|nr:hypothetical protein [Candidatus Methylobacter titanis]
MIERGAFPKHLALTADLRLRLLATQACRHRCTKAASQEINALGGGFNEISAKHQ